MKKRSFFEKVVCVIMALGAVLLLCGCNDDTSDDLGFYAYINTGGLTGTLTSTTAYTSTSTNLETTTLHETTTQVWTEVVTSTTQETTTTQMTTTETTQESTTTTETTTNPNIVTTTTSTAISTLPVINTENGEYIAVKGDGWYPIARKLKSSVEDLLLVNNATLDDTVYVGMHIVIPTEDKIAQAKQRTQSSNSGETLGVVTLYTNTVGTNSWVNICLSAERLNGMTLKPGESFSWFTYPGLGPCGKDEGFALAGSYNGSVLSQAYGGGICFTATALYQCARAAGIPKEKIEHYDHSGPVTYAERGEEAAINWGTKNLSFPNTTGYTIVFYTQSNAKNGSLTITCKVA